MFDVRAVSNGICCLFQVIVESKSEEEIAGLKEMFKMIDTENSGSITFEELKEGLKRVGCDLMESEIQQLMEAVSFSWLQIAPNLIFKYT